MDVNKLKLVDPFSMVVAKNTILRKSALGTSQEEVYAAREAERILYARNKPTPGARPALPPGRPVTEELAVDLRMTCFGSASVPTRGEWSRSPLLLRPPAQALSFGLLAPRNSARALLSALQAFLIKWLLFDSRPVVARDAKGSEPPETYLRASEERQEEALWQALSDVIWRCAGAGAAGAAGVAAGTGTDRTAVVALPTNKTYVQHSGTFYQDNITEKVVLVRIPGICLNGPLTSTIECFKLHLFEFKKLEDLQIFIKRYLFMFQAEDGAGALLLLYAAVLSRGCDNVRRDMDQSSTHVAPAAGEGSLAAVTLLLTGRATPYLHNGVVYVGDEDHYAMPQFGILARAPVGLLVWSGAEESLKLGANKQTPGSRLKTPAAPIWVTCCSGHYGVLFNTNRELLRNYHAERRFEITYYTVGGAHVALQVDTRGAAPRPDDISASALERLLHTKWQDAIITWSGLAANGTGDSPR